MSKESAVLKRTASAGDVAQQVVAFCRSDSVTGQVLNIDGGMHFH
jgi:3-oxoacyl-[acyl-carrier protein] reductase